MSPKLKKLLRRLKTGDFAQRARAAEELAFIDEEPMLRRKALIAALDDEDDLVRSHAIDALRHRAPTPGELVPRLLGFLKENDYCTKLASIVALSEVRPVTAEIATALIDVIDDPKWCSEAARAVSDLGPASKAAVPRLIAVLRQDQEMLAVIEALGRIGPDAAASVPELCQCLGSLNPFAVVRAVEALGLIGPAASAAVPQLVSLPDDDAAMARAEAEFNDWKAAFDATSGPKMMSAFSAAPGRIRVSVALALWRICRYARSIEMLMDALTDEGRGVRLAAIDGVDDLRIPHEPFAAALGRMACSDPDVSVRCRALWVLPVLGPSASAAVKSVIKALRDGDRSVRKAAAETLGRLGPVAKPAAPRLKKLSAVRNASMRVAAADALWRIARDENAIDSLMHALTSDRAADREHAASCLCRIGPTADRALPVLETLLADNDARVRRQAAQAIERIRGASPWN